MDQLKIRWVLAQEEAEEKEGVLDADALERKRMREAEEWRVKQLRAGVNSEDNSNFQVGQRSRTSPRYNMCNPFFFQRW